MLLTDNGLRLHSYRTATPELWVETRALHLPIFLLHSDEAVFFFFVVPGASKHSGHRQQKLWTLKKSTIIHRISFYLAKNFNIS